MDFGKETVEGCCVAPKHILTHGDFLNQVKKFPLPPKEAVLL